MEIKYFGRGSVRECNAKYIHILHNGMNDILKAGNFCELKDMQNCVIGKFV